jgi:hypothetical protein
VHVDAARTCESVIARLSTEEGKSHYSQPAALALGTGRTQFGVAKGLYGRSFTRLESEP